ncbi:uncharacterized protein H6S33_011459 [Morchella sextelata]|uniref:uncharacterized protein n=1 Tax=Morchella sextelata TaxID=1174677 RepID=UPI001D04F040|nr:uncharacterized protein H6S33_011459 [Morchella sextelata]KAH0611032.1 hypothetical protein H6S33_011459 [Morchella sextelata]
MRIAALSLTLLPLLLFLAAETTAAPADNRTWAEMLADIPFPTDPCNHGNLEEAVAKKKATLGSARKKLTPTEELTENGIAVMKVKIERLKKKEEAAKKSKGG